jgi:transposase
MGRPNNNYTDEFKHQIVELLKNGRTVLELEREYKVSKTTIRTWEKQFANSGKFGAENNRSVSEKELKALRKENKQLRMENDILKQAALILGRKDA